MKYLSCGLLAVPLALLVGPAARAQDKMAETPYYPLKIGNTWTYKIGDTHFTMKVVKYEEVESEGKKQTCARVEMSGSDNKVQAVEHIAVRLDGKDDGVYRYMFENKKAEPPVRFLKLPPKKDDTWEVALARWAHAHGYVALYRAGRFALSEEEFQSLFRRSMEKFLNGLRSQANRTA